MQIRGDKIIISRRNMQRLFFGTHSLWEVLRIAGAQLIDGKGVVPKGEHPADDVSGFLIPGSDDPFILSLGKAKLKFVTSIPTLGEKLRIKECRVAGMPVLACD